MTNEVLKDIELSLKQLDSNCEEVIELCTTIQEQLKELKERLNDTEKDVPCEELYDVHNEDFI